MRRRTYISALGTAAASALLAGCSSGSDGTTNGGGGETSSSGSSTSTSTTTTETASPTKTTTTEQTTTATATPTSSETPASTSMPATEDETTGTTLTDAKTTTETDSSTATAATSSQSSGSASAKVLQPKLKTHESEYSTEIAMTGFVQNTGDGVLRLPEVSVRFYDEDDSILNSTTETLNFLKPDTKWEIYEPYYDDGTPDHGKIMVADDLESFQTELGIPEGLKLTGDALSKGEDPTIDATLKNTSDDAISYVSVFAVFYDEDGVALGDALDTLDGLPSGESWKTSLEFLSMDDKAAKRVADYDLYANTDF